VNRLDAVDLTIGHKAGRRLASALNLHVGEGELVCLLGPNGSGKSTLLRTLLGLVAPLSGHVLVGGEAASALDVRALAKRIAAVLTDREIPYAMTARELVALGRIPHTNWMNQFGDEDESAIAWAMQSAGVTAFSDRWVTDLSDGERQKVLLARALAQQPLLLILDEPTAYLDLPRRVEMMGLFARLAHEHGQSLVVSTHDLDLAMRHADRLWLMDGNGSFYQGTTDDLLEQGALRRAFGPAFDDYVRVPRLS
jgi:iron complex transport system ATP-binding protein